MIDENKILLAIICEDEAVFALQPNLFSSTTVNLPNIGTFVLEQIVVLKEKNLATTCNSLLAKNNAKYKFFIATPLNLQGYFIHVIMDKFLMYPKVGIMGLFGSEMPISGDYTKAKNLYGSYMFRDNLGNISGYKGKVPVFYQSVHMIDSSFFVTSEDIPFDEEMDDDFFIAAQCCRYRRAGYDVGVFDLPDETALFSQDNFLYKDKSDDKNYRQQLKKFKQSYKDIVTPLVSICIPTYNEPYFFEKALLSALNQTYENMEIIVGDDSTNEDIKNLIQPYLEQTDKIKYFYHGGPLGANGMKNIDFIVNHSKGNYVNILLHDDIIYPEKISRMMEYFVGDLENKIVLVTSARASIDENDRVIKRMNPWQPNEDTILSGEEVGRTILFSKINFVGETSSVLLKKESLLTKDPQTCEKVFGVAVFCGVKDLVYGDIGCWLDILKKGGDCVFIKDCLSAFREHPQQETHNPLIRTRLFVEFMDYITIAWLNNLYLRNYAEYKFCCDGWRNFLNTNYDWNTPEDSSDLIKPFKELLRNYSRLIVEKKYPELLDFSIRFLLDVLHENNSILPLVRQNEETGLFEKACDGIMLNGEQRY